MDQSQPNSGQSGPKKFLYGAAVQGIQGFIFQTNKLREIVGASELVENICTSLFEQILGSHFKPYNESTQTGAVMQAAGNVKYIFSPDEEEYCRQVVKEFPRAVSKLAPGITVSQTVVRFDGDFSQAVTDLEDRLRIQRNKPMRSSLLGLMGIERSRQTGLPVVEEAVATRYGKEETLFKDEATIAKLSQEDTTSLCCKAFGVDKLSNKQVPHDIEDITKHNDWVAVIHVDGNGLGQVVQRVGSDPKVFRQFSMLLDGATVLAANKAYSAVAPKKQENDKSGVIPIRPIVLSGDDHTLICRADLAIDYIKVFMEEFEKQTGPDSEVAIDGCDNTMSKILVENNVFPQGDIHDRLTSCAGIAFIKSSFPFYYGYSLAETICSQAKKDAKANLVDGELPMSCLMFHKVQDSFTERWDAIRQRELLPADGHSFEFGPYYLQENTKCSRWTIQQLVDSTRMLVDGKEGNAAKSHLRKWMSALANPARAEQIRQRMLSHQNDKMKAFSTTATQPVLRNGVNTYPVYDMLSLHTVVNQVTKEE